MFVLLLNEQLMEVTGISESFRCPDKGENIDSIVQNKHSGCKPSLRSLHVSLTKN